MGKKYEKKITWTIKDFSSLQSEEIYSDHFVVGGCKWRLKVYPKGTMTTDNYFAMYLNVADSELLPCGWGRNANFCLTVVNQLQKELSKVKESSQSRWFDQNCHTVGSQKLLLLTELHDKDGGFLVNDEVKIVAEVNVLEVVGKSDALEEEITLVDVNGFQVLPSQVKYVNLLFERRPNIATNVKNQYLKTGYMNVLFSLIDTLRQLPEQILMGDLVDAYAALESLTDAGFELDWLKTQLNQVEENMKRYVRVCEMEQQLHDLEQKSKDLKTQLDKDKAEISKDTAHDLSFNDVIS